MQVVPDLDRLGIDDIKARLHAQAETTYDIPPEMLRVELLEAAVLMPFIRIEDAWHILYIRRATFAGYKEYARPDRDENRCVVADGYRVKTRLRQGGN